MPQKGDYSIPFIFGPAQRLPNLVEDEAARGFIFCQVDGIGEGLQVVFELVQVLGCGRISCVPMINPPMPSVR